MNKEVAEGAQTVNKGFFFRLKHVGESQVKECLSDKPKAFDVDFLSFH